ncbi:ribosome small subunit-dependent GTPase A [Salipaludibacillus sp. CUR1]|uniref:Small ribosomal subunit biogenesis GTPase RsgA n=1 Tax=Salipaludibacillus aurantiacus TaxID=1601833 RepID=A0A1H9QPY0_9BACI|nr:MULTISPECIES: ribosome small subunit-dependent GTPase A [Salipaludibacillus]MCE7794655.1 ribosome small subunit-dependent GTPase A [Salipaludibacillus sp. CUR1]SER62508.1 ribosome biogenesis GTPase [Salipaludibacillus aurantiacus]
MPRGRIIKALSGFYYVENEDGIFQCRGRGNFRKRKLTPLVGDWVEFEAANKTDGYVLEMEDRLNELVRPPIANVEQAILVFSVESPSFNPVLLDRFLVHIEANNISPVICLSKIDLLSGEDSSLIEKYEEDYKKLGYEVLKTSIYIEETLNQLKPYLSGKVSVFAGQSGVGKSSLLNALKPELNIETNEISKSLGRGKHTTRHVELIPLEEGGYVADTPGFSSLDFQNIETEELSQFFPEMLERINDCKFRACTHINEPSCAVKQAYKDGLIASHRYEHYAQFLDEIKNQKRRY